MPARNPPFAGALCRPAPSVAQMPGAFAKSFPCRPRPFPAVVKVARPEHAAPGRACGQDRAAPPGSRSAARKRIRKRSHLRKNGAPGPRPGLDVFAGPAPLFRLPAVGVWLPRSVAVLRSSARGSARWRGVPLPLSSVFPAPLRPVGRGRCWSRWVWAPFCAPSRPCARALAALLSRPGLSGWGGVARGPFRGSWGPLRAPGA